jgi:hypothetical protein
MTDTNTDNSIIYVFLSLTIVGSLISVGTAMYFSLRCMRARGDIPGADEPLREVVVISPVVGLAGAVMPVSAEHQPQELPLLAAQQQPPRWLA